MQLNGQTALLDPGADSEAQAYQRTNPPAQAPTQRLSMLRLTMVVLILAGSLGYGGSYVAGRLANRSSSGASKSLSWAAAYVDTTLTPYFQFQDPGQNPLPSLVLGFVVASPSDGCTPSWGGAYDMDQAADSLALDRRVAQYRSEGGQPVVSFGGQAHSELALACNNVTDLQAAYQSVVSRYGLQTLDFDIEGSALYDNAAIDRRDAALSNLTAAARKSGHPLSVWVTLPVATSGLTDAGLQVVSRMIQSGVSLSGVNLMTMDYGSPEPNMLTASEQALDHTHQQLSDLYRSLGHPLTSGAVWARMGATAMIGVNDSAGETFTVDDATGLVAYANARHMARLSMWSLNRDQQCGALTFGSTGTHSLTCSGVLQNPAQFSQVLGNFKASPLSAEATSTLAAPSPSPANSPYPTWTPSPIYVEGYRVVRDGYVYQARWDNQAVDPLSTIGATLPSPWELLGPVLPGDKSPTSTTIPTGTYAQWSPTTTYPAGTVVLFAGLPYAARWLTAAASPASAGVDGTSSPWLPLFSVSGEPKQTS
jgi:chitinase